MGMFSMRKPRGFHHEYIYVDERKEKLEKIKENAKRELGMLPPKAFNPEDIRGKFVEGTTHLKKSKRRGDDPRSRHYKNMKLLLALVALAFLFWVMFGR